MNIRSNDLTVTIIESEKEMLLIKKCQRMLGFHSKDDIIENRDLDTSLEDFLGGAPFTKQDIHYFLLKKYCLAPQTKGIISQRITNLMQEGDFESLDNALTCNRAIQDEILENYLIYAHTPNTHLSSISIHRQEQINQMLQALANFYSTEKEKMPLEKRRNYN